MHREQIEALVQEHIEKTLGDVQTLQDLHQVLKRTNVSTRRPGDTADPLNAGLFHSLFLSHVRLAQMVSDLVMAHQNLQNRVDELEKAVPASQEAIINLQQRLQALESRQ